MKHQPITEQIIDAAKEVHKTLGNGFEASVYNYALLTELNIRNIRYANEKGKNIVYKGYESGRIYADIIVDKQILVVIKAVENIKEIHRVRAANYLKVYGLDVGLIINFANENLQFEKVIKPELYSI